VTGRSTHAGDLENVLVEVTDGVGTITLNRPDKLNAFAGRMRDDVLVAVERLAGDPAVRVLVLTGAGRAFCAGADIGSMRDLLADDDTKGMAALVESGRRIVTRIHATPKPVIASVNGPAAGGGANLALACDIRIASDRASVGQTFNRIGLHPDWGGTYFLPRLVGQSKALELIFTGDMVDAPEALRIGLFDRVVPHDELASATMAVAELLAAKPPRALALAKRAVYESLDGTMDEVLDRELVHQLECFSSDDTREGLSAFLEKREPRFRGT
jgi:2-(1,2-epoxy-1,2-dihydrophenyl)acetyl-CoA isomerase